MGKHQTNFLLPSAVQKYYDQWGRITSRHEHWSTPEYYHEAEEKLRKRMEGEEKKKVLVERQEKLRAQLLEEKKRLDNEMQGNFNSSLFLTGEINLKIHFRTTTTAFATSANQRVGFRSTNSVKR